MRQKIDKRIPRYGELITHTFSALKKLGGSGGNNEILKKIIEMLDLPDEVVDITHKGHESVTELDYQAAWARTYLKKYGVIDNISTAVWAITPEFSQIETIDGKQIYTEINKQKVSHRNNSKTEKDDTNAMMEDDTPEDEGIDVPDEVKGWRTQLADVLQKMDPYAFERLAQRILRACGFTEVIVTKASGDGGIDGTGRLKVNGIFSLNVAFQCKRYVGSVGASTVREFRGSLSKSAEKGILITTGTFTKAAREDASNSGKEQIDLIDGEELIDLIATHKIGVREEIIYKIDEDFFAKI